MKHRGLIILLMLWCFVGSAKINQEAIVKKNVVVEDVEQNSSEDFQVSVKLQRARFDQKKNLKKKNDVQDPEKDFSEDPDVLVKLQRAKKHVEKAVLFFNEKTLGQACRAFEKDPQWIDGEFFIFVFDTDGSCLLFGNEVQALWENFYNFDPEKDERGSTLGKIHFIDEMIKVGFYGGWVSYYWNHGLNYSYVKTVQKGDKTYIMGTGFYPESSKFLVKQLVKRAIQTGIDFGAPELFRRINNPTGDFVMGDVYLWAYDMLGNAFAHGRNLAIVGQNRLSWKDSQGKYRNKIMIDLVQEKGSAWVDYDEYGINKFAYVDSFVDPKTDKQYMIGGGYYPRISEDVIISFVKRGVNHLKSEGAAIAFRDFTSQSGGFIQGPLRLFVYDLEGTVLVDAQNPIFIGQNLIGIRDSEGKYVVKESIDLAMKAGRGWVTFVDNDAYKTEYIELVEIPDGKYIIGSGYWPSSKEHTARSLAQKAVTYFESHDIVDSLKQFSGTSSEYLRGDLFVSVYSENGICLAHGIDRERIWFDETKKLDKNGYSFIEQVIATAKQGGGWVEYEKNNYPYRAYAKMVTKKINLQGASSAEIKQRTKSHARVTSNMQTGEQKSQELFFVTVGYFK